ncbi:uncharacterized protein LOC143892126 [Tasmannia lanceolata]|uniref:uncharacterized protein LOC143892126 n=1 Tax=Tasmannia lanceolata TaxID=3420 RepID=UPI004064C49A
MAGNFGFKHCPINTSVKYCKWTAPKEDEFKLNMDASLTDEGGGIGGIIRNASGQVIHIFSISVDKDEIFSLEIQAICEGIGVAEKLGISNLWIETDSTFAVDSINKKTDPPWKKLDQIFKARHKLGGMNWKISHIWREANAAADFLSKRNCPFKGVDIPLEGIPEPLHQILCDDMRGKFYQRL